MFVQLTFEDAKTKPCHIFFYKDQTITANVAIERNYIFIDDTLSEGAIWKDCSLTLYKYRYT